MSPRSSVSLVRDVETNAQTKFNDETSQTSSWTQARLHTRRWWWLHLFIFLSTTFTITLLILFVAVRAIVQSQFNKATLEVISEAVTLPRPDSFQLQLETKQYTHSSYEPVVESFNASLSLPGSDTPFLYFVTPTIQTASVFNLTVNQNVTIVNMEEFIAYNKAVYHNETVNVQVRGQPKVVLKALPKYRVTYDRITTQKGLNSLQGFEIVSLNLFPNPDPVDNATMTNTILIPNPSQLTIEMGTVTEDLYSPVNNTYLGYVTIPDFVLRPGDNCLEARGFIDPQRIASFVTVDNILPLEIRGRKSVNNDGQELEYYSETLRSSTIRYDLNITAAVAPDAGVARCGKRS